jgi:hypothetical protein
VLREQLVGGGRAGGEGEVVVVEPRRRGDLAGPGRVGPQLETVGQEHVLHALVGEERGLLRTDDAGDDRGGRRRRLLPAHVAEHHEPDHAQ